MNDIPPPSGDAVLGARLRSARDKAELSLEQLALATRISKNYLSALENGEFSRLPGTAYVCGFMKAYAAAVGLDGDQLVQEYQRDHAPAGGAQGNPTPFKAKVVGPEARRQWGVTGVLFVLVIIVSSVMNMTDEPSKPAAKPPAPSAAVYTPPSTVQAQMSSSASLSAAVDLQQDLPPLPTEQSASSGGIFLRIRANQDCWLSIDLDGEMGRQYILRPGDVIEWKALSRFSLDVGNAGGIQVEFNGKELQPLGKQGETVHLELKAEEGN